MPDANPDNGSKKFSLNKADAPAILKSWGLGAALSVVVFTGTFLLGEIDWGPLAAFVTMAVPPAVTTVSRWLTELRK